MYVHTSTCTIFVSYYKLYFVQYNLHAQNLLVVKYVRYDTDVLYRVDTPYVIMKNNV